MNEIDWSKAPEGAMYYVPEWGFFRCEHGEWWQFLSSQWIKTAYGSPENFSWFGAAIPRPLSPAWDGECLPPVGTHIEWFSPIYGWLGGRVVGHDGSVTVVVHNDGYTGCHPHEVRPIRTPEQIAAEEREKAVQKMLAAAGVTGSAFADDPEAAVWAAALYDAGYRKVEP